MGCGAWIVAAVLSLSALIGDPPGDLAVGELGNVTVLGRVGAFPAGTSGLSTLVTLCNVGASDIPWRAAMDEAHPGVALQLYRLAPGPSGHERLVQVGTSWVSHRFAAAAQAACGPCAGQSSVDALPPDCSDTISASGQGSAFWLGPRSEWNGHTGAWTCEGSFFDGLPVDCLRDEDGSGLSPTEARLEVADAELLVPGSTFLYEAVALNGNEQAPFDNVASRQVTFFWSGASWIPQVPSAGNPLVPGPAVLRFGDDSASADLVPHDGQVVAAVDVTELGGGLWRYELALLNRSLDGGIDRIELPVGSVVADAGFADGDDDPADDWTLAVSGTSARWSAPTGSDPLAWGELLSFGFTTDAPPAPGDLRVSVAEPGPGGEALELSLTLPADDSAFTDEGCALAGATGEPWLTGNGDLSAGSTNAVDLSSAAPSATAGLFLALASTPVPFKGGTLKPVPFFDPVIVSTSAAGQVPLPFVMPAGVPSGTELWVQWAIQDAAAAKGVALSNAVRGVTP
jgi:hypothetical protein